MNKHEKLVWAAAYAVCYHRLVEERGRAGREYRVSEAVEFAHAAVVELRTGRCDVRDDYGVGPELEALDEFLERPGARRRVVVKLHDRDSKSGIAYFTVEEWRGRDAGDVMRVIMDHLPMFVTESEVNTKFWVTVNTAAKTEGELRPLGWETWPGVAGSGTVGQVELGE